MATTTAKGSGSTVNNNGTIVNAGTPGSDSPISNVLNPNNLAIGDGTYGSQVVAQDGTMGDYSGVSVAKSGGTGGLAYFPNAQAGERNFIVKAAGDSASKINNDADTILTVPGSEVSSAGIRQVNTVHAIVDTRRYGSASSTTFNVFARPSSAMVPGRVKGAGAGADSDFVQMDGSTAATDDAASPTRAVPGELTYHFGGLAQPSTDEYKAKDSYEA